jgi:hypothetical protein
MVAGSITIAETVEEEVARFGARQALHQVFHQLEAAVIDRQREEREQRHGHLHPAQQPRRRCGAVHQAANGKAAQCQAEDERGQHQLEGMSGGAEHEREHSDPADLVDEGRKTGEERDEQQQARHARCLQRFALRRQGGGSSRTTRQQRDRRREQEVERAGCAQGAGQPGPGDQHEAARQDACGGAQAVGEVKHRHCLAGRLAGASGIHADQRGAHQRKGRAQQHRLRQDQQAGDHELGAKRESLAAQPRQERRVGPVGQQGEHIVEREGAQADRGFDRRIGEERVDHARGAPRAESGAQCHAAHENDEHQRLRVGGVPEVKLQVVRPDRFVDQPGEARHDEQQVERKSWRLRRNHARAYIMCRDGPRLNEY